MLVLLLNFIVTRLSALRAGRRSWGALKPVLPPPVRRIAVGGAPTVAEPAPGGPAHGGGAGNGSRELCAAQRSSRPPVARAVERMRIESVWLAYGEHWVVETSRCRCARARCWR